MSDFLQIMASHSAARAAAVSSSFSSADFDKPVVPLTLGKFDVIAEIKDRSPAEGDLRSYGDSDRNSRAKSYAAGGAAAISVLTEPSRFDGDLSHLETVVAAVPGTPVMRKDFLVEPVQILEARKAGAGQLLVGVNTRNLRTLKVDPDRLKKLAATLPGAVCVAESGLVVPDDAARVAGWGYRIALVGTALMRSEDPAELIAAMRKAGASV